MSCISGSGPGSQRTPCIFVTRVRHREVQWGRIPDGAWNSSDSRCRGPARRLGASCPIPLANLCAQRHDQCAESAYYPVLPCVLACICRPSARRSVHAVREARARVYMLRICRKRRICLGCWIDQNRPDGSSAFCSHSRLDCGRSIWPDRKWNGCQQSGRGTHCLNHQGLTVELEKRP